MAIERLEGGQQHERGSTNRAWDKCRIHVCTSEQRVALTLSRIIPCSSSSRHYESSVYGAVNIYTGGAWENSKTERTACPYAYGISKEAGGGGSRVWEMLAKRRRRRRRRRMRMKKHRLEPGGKGESWKAEFWTAGRGSSPRGLGPWGKLNERGGLGENSPRNLRSRGKACAMTAWSRLSRNVKWHVENWRGSLSSSRKLHGGASRDLPRFQSINSYTSKYEGRLNAHMCEGVQLGVEGKTQTEALWIVARDLVTQ